MSDGADPRELEAEVERLRRMLARQNRLATLGHMLAGIVHDIGTPIGAIEANAGMAKTLLDRVNKALPEDSSKLTRSVKKLSETVDTIAIGAGRISAMVRSLKDFSRDDDGTKAPVDVHAVIDRSVQLCGFLFAKRITVTKNYGEVPAIEGHQGKLGQVFVNLLTNAAQAIEGEGTIVVTTRLEGGQVVIDVADDGAGFAEGAAERVFEAGFSTKGDEGSGIGLAIVRGIVEHHGGSITASSAPSGGAVFTITLPS